MEQRLKAIAGRQVSPAEMRAWRHSLMDVSQFLLAPQIPPALGVAIRQTNGGNRARLVAGYCWKRQSRNNQALNDITIPEHGYAARWNLASDGNTWIMSFRIRGGGLRAYLPGPGGGHDRCDHRTGPGGARRPAAGVTSIARARSDKSLSGWRQAMVQNPEATRARVSRLIRNSYLTLMSRGMKSCWVCACDPEPQQDLRERLEAPADCG